MLGFSGRSVWKWEAKILHFAGTRINLTFPIEVPCKWNSIVCGAPHSLSFSITSYSDCIPGDLLTCNTFRPAASASHERLLSLVCEVGDFPASVSSTIFASVIAAFQGDWVTKNFLVQELYRQPLQAWNVESRPENKEGTLPFIYSTKCFSLPFKDLLKPL